MAEHFNPFAGSNSGGGGGTSEKVRYTIKKETNGTSGEVTYKLMQSINSGSQTVAGEIIGFNGNSILVNYGDSVVLLNTAIENIEELLDKTYNFTTFSELNIDTHNKTLTQITQELIAKHLPANTIVTGQLYSSALPFDGNGEAEVIINPPAYWWKCGSLDVAPYSWQAITGSSSWGDQGMVMDWTPTSYTLPTASANTLGGVKIGSGIDITDGVISVTQYVLPPATQSTIGGIIVGEGLDVDANGTLSVTLDGFALGTVTTTTGQPGTEANVTVVEDSLVLGTYNFSFTVPAGANGADGVDGQNGQDGHDGQDGQDGQNGQDGQDGVGITSITKTSSEGLVDMYTITYTDAHTSAFYVTNGANGTNGTNGTDGISITGASINQYGELILTMSSGPAINAGVVKGADGTSVNIIDDLPSTSDLPSTGQHAGDCYIIDGHLWVYTGGTAAGDINGFTDAGNIRGPEGRSVVAVAVTNGDLYVTYSDSNVPVRVGPVVGPAGKGISSITKTGTVGLVDTYTVTYTDNTTFAYSISNGRSISSITKTGTSGLADTYTITYNDSTSSTFTVTNGADGTDGADGADGESAYQIWLDEGNVGTEQDFLDSLKADKNEVQVTTTNTQPTDPEVELWVDLSSTQVIQVPEIDDTTTSAVNTWSSNKINTELNNKLQQPLSSLLFSKTIDLGAVTTTVYPGGSLGDGAIVLYLPAENGTLALKGDIPETTRGTSTMTISTADAYANINNLTFTAENGKSYLIVATATITDPRDAGRPTGIAISSSEGYGYIGISEISASLGAISLSTTCLYTNSSGASSTISVAVKTSAASEYRVELFVQEIS